MIHKKSFGKSNWCSFHDSIIGGSRIFRFTKTHQYSF